jgi:uncharacterized protein (TIGR02145 family)
MGQLMRYVMIVLNCMVINLALQAQTVRNVKATQEGQKIAIAYELECTQPTEINLFLSEDNGKTWSALKTGVSGDVGWSVTQGSKVIYWDVLQSKEKLVGNAFVFKVKVSEEFKTVKIGSQVWMAENLNVDHYRNGDPISEMADASLWNSLSSGAWCYYGNDISNGEAYGKLYNWYAVNDSRCLCPNGWHVPSDQDWNRLEEFLGGSDVAGGKMKSVFSWSSPNSGASNSSEFKGLPGGYRNIDGNFVSNGTLGYWWSNTSYDFFNALYRSLHYRSTKVYSLANVKRIGSSVRCIKD